MQTLHQGSDRSYELATDLAAPMPTPEQVEAREVADSWRQIADFIETNPDKATAYLGGGRSWHLGVPHDGPESRSEITQWVVAARRFGAEVQEWTDGTYAGVLVTFGRITLKVYANISWLTDVPAEPQVKTYRPLLADEPSGGDR